MRLELQKHAKTYSYQLISLETNSSDPDLLDIDVRLQRKSRRELVLSGYVDIKYDIQEGDDTEIEWVVYHSPTGSESDYKLLPFNIRRQSIYDYFNSFYKDFIMNGIANCSDLWVFDGKAPSPLEKKRYEINGCVLNDDHYPNHLGDGFYRIVGRIYGQVQCTIMLLIEVMRKF
uniref:Uncharacterized protein n=1 Tax=Glossina austeni TaxID=7395 RepID=A0A1A9VSF8_GLOAU